MRRTPSPQRLMGGTWPGWVPRRGGAQKMQICRNFLQIVKPSYKLMQNCRNFRPKTRERSFRGKKPADLQEF